MMNEQKKQQKPEATWNTKNRIDKMSHAELALVFERQARRITNQRRALKQLNRKLKSLVDSARAREHGKVSVDEMTHELKKAHARVREAEGKYAALKDLHVDALAQGGAPITAETKAAE